MSKSSKIIILIFAFVISMSLVFLSDYIFSKIESLQHLSTITGENRNGKQALGFVAAMITYIVYLQLFPKNK